MTSLEHITRILELHAQGKTTTEIAQKLLTSKQEQRYEQIKQAIEKGAPNVEAIANQTGLSLSTVYTYARNAEIPLPNTKRHLTRKNFTRNQLVQQIRDAIDAGAQDVSAIAEQIGIQKSSIYIYAKKAGIDLPSTRPHMSLQTRLAQIQDALQNTNNFEELAAQLDLAPTTIISYLHKHNIPTQFSIPKTYLVTTPRRRSKIDKLIEQGLTQTEIGNLVGLSSERIRQYLLSTGQYNSWNEKQKEKHQEPEQCATLAAHLAGILKEHTLKRAHNEEDWATKKALEQVMKYKGEHAQRYPFEYVYAVLSTYQQAQKEGKKLSLEELGQEAEIHSMDARRILLNAGVPAMYRTHKRHITPSHKKQAIDRSKELQMSATDISYFIDIPQYTVDQRWRMQGHRNTRCGLIKKFERKRKSLTYRLASQIYEAIDEGFTTKETAEILHTASKAVDYALENRTKIESELIEILKVIYDDNNIEKPYWRKF